MTVTVAFQFIFLYFLESAGGRVASRSLDLHVVVLIVKKEDSDKSRSSLVHRFGVPLQTKA